MLHRYLNHLWDEMSDTGRRMFRWDLVRGAASGAVGTVQMTFALLVAITVFEAGTVAKSLIAGAHAIGLLLSLPYASWSPVLARKTVRAAAPAFGAALGLVVAAMAQSTATYTCGIVMLGTCSPLALPVMTAVYRENYRGRVRGQVFGITVIISVLVGLATQFSGGAALEADLGLFRPLFLVLAAMTSVMGLAILMMPHRGVQDVVSPNPLTSFGAVRENPMFGFLLAYILLYFHTRSLPFLVLASACLGTSFGGGSIAWSLWVTKFAPAAETARYMSVHTFMTGIRGACAPLAGYLCVEALTIQTTAWLSAGLVMLSIAMLWRVRNRPTRTEPIRA